MLGNRLIETKVKVRLANLGFPRETSAIAVCDCVCCDVGKSSPGVIYRMPLLSRKEEETEQFFSTVRPEEVPEIPSHKFLFRGSPPKKVEADRFVLHGYCAFTFQPTFSSSSSSSIGGGSSSSSCSGYTV